MPKSARRKKSAEGSPNSEDPKKKEGSPKAEDPKKKASPEKPRPDIISAASGPVLASRPKSLPETPRPKTPEKKPKPTPEPPIASPRFRVPTLSVEVEAQELRPQPGSLSDPGSKGAKSGDKGKVSKRKPEVFEVSVRGSEVKGKQGKQVKGWKVPEPEGPPPPRATTRPPCD